MAFNNLLISLLAIFSLLSLSSQSHHRRRLISARFYPFPYDGPDPNSGGEWALLHKSIGVSAMHMQLLFNNKVVIFDRTDFGASNLPLPPGSKCRFNDQAIKIDCTAHSLIYDVATNTFRPLMVQTDVWCSSGSVLPNGTLVQTGGYLAGNRKIRLFTPCNDEKCNWVELEQNLTVQRWYSSNHILPDGRVIIVGGRRAFSYEFFPKNDQSLNVFPLPFLQETSDPIEENNLYPFLHLLPDGNLYIFANQRSILLDYVKNRIVREFPAIPDAKRSYPATGSSVLLPLRLIGGEGLPEAEVMICGGSVEGAYLKARAGIHVPASASCGRMKLTDADPKWVMEEMPMGRVMPDMLLLPTGDVIILNGANKGTAGWELADDPVLNPVLYSPPSQRFRVLNPTLTARMYHSAATLLPDGRILVGGSNPHIQYNFTNVKYPTELSLEAFSPPYMNPQFGHLKPSIVAVEGPTEYGQKFSLTFTAGLIGSSEGGGGINVMMMAPSFTTHSFAMNQRLLVLDATEVEQISGLSYKVTAYAPPSRSVAPLGYYMLFVVNDGVPSHCVWIKMI